MGCSSSNTLNDSDIQKAQAKKKYLKQKQNSKKIKDKENEEDNVNHSNGKRKKRKEEIKEMEDKKEKKEETNIFLKVHILMKNLEVKITDSKDVKEKLKKIFDTLLEKIEEFKVEVMIEKVTNFFIEYLKPINKKNYESVKNILNSLYEKDKNPNFFSEYLYEAFGNLSDFGKLGEVEETKIDDYIIKNLNKNEEIQKRKNELKQNRKKSYIINYNDFAQIVKDYNINMDNLVLEYLLYKMKYGLPLNEKYSLDDLNFKIFFDYLDKSNELDIKESDFLKGSELDNKIENIGIEFKNKDS